MNYCVYILRSQHFMKSYVGSTDDIQRRLKEHNAGKMAFTKKYKPWEIVLTESYDTLKDARKRELYLKSGVGRRYLKKLFNQQSEVV